MIMVEKLCFIYAKKRNDGKDVYDFRFRAIANNAVHNHSKGIMKNINLETRQNLSIPSFTMSTILYWGDMMTYVVRWTQFV